MRGRSVLFATAAALLLATVPAAPGGATGTAPSSPAGGGSTAAAEQALAEAVAVLGKPGRRTSLRGGASTDADAPVEATMVLRDLRMQYRGLSRADRRTARQVLGRPTGLQGGEPVVAAYEEGDAPTSVCPELPSADLCVHWATNEAGRHAPDLTDDSGNGVPDYVDTVAHVMDTVWADTTGRLGYRAPQSDEDSVDPGADESPGSLDVYLADLGGQFYGYCTSDDPEAAARKISAFCVLDNDYDRRQFGGAAPIKSLRATAAHEFFHAVQFGYDFFEDLWFMEGTATWIEDEIFDGVNDNRQYLGSSQLRTPWVPLDCVARPKFGCDGNFPYGTWAFWRFLSETTNPAIVRQTWERAQGKTYSLRAVSGALRARNRSFGPVFADFGRITRISKRWFSEGRTYPQARPFKLRPVTNAGHRRWLQAPINHLAHENIELVPHKSLTRRGKLRLRLDLPFRARGSHASVVVRMRSGRLREHRVTLNRKGDDRLVVPFDSRRVAGVMVTFTNASTRMRSCGGRSTWSCGGTSRDDGLTFAFRAAPFRG